MQCRDEAVDLCLLTVSAVEYRDTSGNGVDDDLAKLRDVVGEMISADVDPVSEVILCLVPYCKTIVSSEWPGDLHVPDAAHAKYIFVRIVSDYHDKQLV